MNWGFKIVLLYVGFILFISYLIFRCTHENTDLVVQDYYGKELAFGDQYNRQKNSNEPGMKAEINYDADAKNIRVIYPVTVKDSLLSGEINFYRPDNKTLDFSLAVKSVPEQEIDVTGLNRGLWKIQMKWNTKSRGFYQEKQVYIP